MGVRSIQEIIEDANEAIVQLQAAQDGVVYIRDALQAAEQALRHYIAKAIDIDNELKLAMSTMFEDGDVAIGDLQYDISDAIARANDDLEYNKEE